MSRTLKQGQVSFMIVLGLLLVILTGISLVLYSKDQEQDSSPSHRQDQHKEEFTAYIESCITQSTIDSAKLLGAQGGTLKETRRLTHDKNRRVLATYTGQGYTHTIQTKQELSLELNEDIAQRLQTCVDESAFRLKGVQTTRKDPIVNTRIEEYTILVDVTYPMTLQHTEYSLTLNSFERTVPSSLGFMLDLSREILNTEVTQGAASKEKLMLGISDLTIHKQKPYPHILYDLSLLDLTFSFAIEGQDTPEQTPLTFRQSGCCRQENTCWKNADDALCEGVYDSNVACSCETQITFEPLGCCVSDTCSISSKQECTGEFVLGDTDCSTQICPALDCASTYNYVSNDYSNPARKHGESWCVYQSMAGKGLDYVGTQHYLHSCIDGVEHVEPCRDFREELCTESGQQEPDGARTRAMCRPNRWHDCATQTNQQSCEDLSVRDCSWSNFLWWEEPKCHPHVPVGNRFWQGDGRHTCSHANRLLSDFGKEWPDAWLFSSTLYCQRSGDCGNYRNRQDKLTKQGYYHPAQDPPSWTYWDEGFTRRGDEFSVKLPLHADPVKQHTATTPLQRGYATCSPWQAPLNGDCTQCQQSSVHPCTEYHCRSIGQNCVYTSSSQTCTSRGTLDTTPPRIASLDFGNYRSSKQQSSYFGVDVHAVASPVAPYTPFSVQFTTSQPTRCRISTRPPAFVSLGITSLGQVTLPEIFLNDYDFKTLYDVEFRLPSMNLTGRDQFFLFLRCTNEQGFSLVDEPIISLSIKEPLTDIDAPEILQVEQSNTQVTVYANEPVRFCKGGIRADALFDLGCNATSDLITYEVGAPLGSYPCYGTSDQELAVIVCEDFTGNQNKAIDVTLLR